MKLRIRRSQNYDGIYVYIPEYLHVYSCQAESWKSILDNYKSTKTLYSIKEALEFLEMFKRETYGMPMGEVVHEEEN